MNEYIDIVFDGPPSHESGRFVEVEDVNGKSISFGEWVERDDGYWALRIQGGEAANELAERLQEYAGQTAATGRLFRTTCREAAAAITKLQAENERLKDALRSISMAGTSQPAALNMPEGDWYRNVAFDFIHTATYALAEQEVESR